MASWMTEGTAHRTPVQRTPIIHILVHGGEGWVLWCSSGKGREDNPHGNRLCPKCRELARDAFDEEMADVEDVKRWLTDEQVARAEARTEKGNR